MICIECNELTGSDDLICPDCLQEISGYSDEDFDDNEHDIYTVITYSKLAKQAKDAGQKSFSIPDMGFDEHIVKILGGKWDVYASKVNQNVSGYYEVSIEQFEKWLHRNDCTLEEMAE
jgi:RNA polymerase subunit RPABC4/transcription elongation factor Spt4